MLMTGLLLRLGKATAPGSGSVGWGSNRKCSTVTHTVEDDDGPGLL